MARYRRRRGGRVRARRARSRRGPGRSLIPNVNSGCTVTTTLRRKIDINAPFQMYCNAFPQAGDMFQINPGGAVPAYYQTPQLRISALFRHFQYYRIVACSYRIYNEVNTFFQTATSSDQNVGTTSVPYYYYTNYRALPLDQLLANAAIAGGGSIDAALSTQQLFNDMGIVAKRFSTPIFTTSFKPFIFRASLLSSPVIPPGYAPSGNTVNSGTRSSPWLATHQTGVPGTDDKLPLTHLGPIMMITQGAARATTWNAEVRYIVQFARPRTFGLVTGQNPGAPGPDEEPEPVDILSETLM